MFVCCCNPVPCIDLNKALEDKNSSCGDRQTLIKSLARFGFCHVSVDRSQLDSSSPLHSLDLRLKSKIESLFDAEFLASLHSFNKEIFHLNKQLCYRGRTVESGSSSSSTAEPKQSWEAKRCRGHNENPINSRLDLLFKWTDALHLVASMVTQALRLPHNTLIRDGPCNAESCFCRNTDNCNVDLLRVFLYDSVNEPRLGSSPHTDWGSWTVVWQDDVGGLQTFCHVHDKWIDVKPSSPSEMLESRVRFVVHVGDVTSLAMGQALESQQLPRQNRIDGSFVWPSPLHRVVSPSKSIPRMSLVYFAYPPPGLYLNEIAEALVHWWRNSQQTTGAAEENGLPLGHYSLLQNQEESAALSSSLTTYENIVSRPLDVVFSEKWQQVQRR